MIARILAFVVAVGMIVGAIAYRSGQDDGGAGGGGPGRLPVVCASELGPMCDGIAGAVVEPAGATADRLLKVRSAAEAGLSAWVAPGPWAAMVDEARNLQAGEPLFDRPRSLGHTPLVAVVKKGQLPPACAGTATWRCLGDAAQNPAFRIGGEPAGEAPGLFVRAAALSGFVGAADYGSDEFDGDGGGWLANLNARLAAAPGFGATSLQQFLVVPASVTAYLTTGAAAKAAGTPASVDVVVPTPAGRIDAVVAPARGRKAPVDRDKLARALSDQGWEPGPVRGDDGLPSPDVLLALREFIG